LCRSRGRQVAAPIGSKKNGASGAAGKGSPMKILKYVAFVLGGIAALLAAAAIFLAATFDANRIKSEITRIVKEKNNRTLAIEGDLGLSFWPNVGVSLGRTTLSERDSAKEFAALEHVRVSVAVMPLLSKQVVVDEVRLDGVKANLIRDRDGKFNFDDLLSKEKQESETVKFDVAGVKLANGQLSFRDEKAGQAFTLSNVSLTTGRLGNAAEGPLELALKLVADKPKLDAQLKTALRYRYDLEQRHYALAALDLKLTGEAAGIKGLDAALAADRLELNPEKSEIMLEKVQLAAKGKAGTDGFDVKVDTPRLTASADKAAGESIAVTATLAGAQRRAEAKLNLAGVEGSASAFKVASLKLDIDAKQGETAVKGGLASSVDANLSTQTFALAKFSGEFDVANPQMPMKRVKLPVSGSARADLAKSNASGDIATRFDESSIRAKWTVAKFSPLALGFDVDVDRINVDKYFPPKPREAKQAGPEKPFDFSAIKGLNANGIVKIGSLQVSNVKANNIRLEIRAADGKLDASPVAANLYQGSLAGSVSVNANNNQVALKQNLTGININPLMKDALDKDLLEGRGNVALDLTTAGTTVAAMKKALNGSGRVALKDGAIKGINLAKTFRELKARVSTKQDAVQQASQSDKTDFSELTASFHIVNGVARNNDLAAKSPFMRLAGEGEVNIAEGQMNYLAKASVVGTAAGQEGKELAELKGVTVPVRVTGPFERLSYRLEFANLVTDLAKAKVEAKVEEEKRKLQEKGQQQLQEQLKGLFKR
jgi:AsmA protein